MSNESENKTDTVTHDAYQTIYWTYKFTKEQMLERIVAEGLTDELAEYGVDLSAIGAQELLDAILEAGLGEVILNIDYSIKDAVDGSSIKTDI